MSTETTAPATAPEVTNLRDARKAQAAAKKPAAKATPAKAPAKKAPAKATASKTEKVAAEKVTYTAKARSGQEVFRKFSTVMTHAIDVSDPKATKELPRKGQVWGFYSSAEKAEVAAGKLRAKGFDVVITTAKAVTVAAKASA